MSSKIVKSLSAKFELLRASVSSGGIVLITGLPSTGKTTVAKRVLDEHPDYMYIYINCNNIATTSMLYLEILRLLHRELNSYDDNKKFRLKSTIDSLNFFSKYKAFLNKARAEGFRRVFIILDQIELLKKTPMMDAFVCMTSSLNRGSQMDFIIISGESKTDLIDAISSIRYRTQFEFKLAAIELNVWDKEDLIDSILEQLPTESVDLYKKFVHNVVSTVYSTNSKDFVELRSFCQENFGSFLGFYRNKTCEMLEKAGLLTDGINFDDVDFDEYEEALPSIGASINLFLSSFKDLIRNGEVRDWGYQRVDRKVTLHTAALITASYVAAYTRLSDDKRNFILYQRRLSKRARTVDHSDDKPRAFTMERLIQIYRSIITLTDGNGLDESSKNLRQDSVLSDIQLLQDLDLISIASGDGLDAQTRFKLSYHVSRAYVDTISKNMGFDLNSLTGLPLVSR